MSGIYFVLELDVAVPSSLRSLRLSGEWMNLAFAARATELAPIQPLVTRH